MSFPVATSIINYIQLNPAKRIDCVRIEFVHGEVRRTSAKKFQLAKAVKGKKTGKMYFNKYLPYIVKYEKVAYKSWYFVIEKYEGKFKGAYAESANSWFNRDFKWRPVKYYQFKVAFSDLN